MKFYPKMERLAKELRQEIAEGRHGGDGTPFMTTRYLMKERNISLKTAHRLLGRLCADGLLEVRGKRYYLTTAQKEHGRMRIGLLLTRLDTAYFSNLAANLEEITRENGAELIIALSGYDADVERKRLDMFLKQGVSGIIACPWAVEENETLFATLPVPSILIGRTLPHQKTGAVLVDNLAAARLVAKHLATCGCREFFYRGPDNLTFDQRLQGFRTALLENGLALPENHILRWPEDSDPPGLENEFLAACKTPGGKAGIFCYHDLFAARIIGFCHEQKIAIPAQAAVVGFDNLPVASAIWPPLTSVAYPVRTIARAAADILFDRIRSERNGGGTALFLEAKLIVRRSTNGA